MAAKIWRRDFRRDGACHTSFASTPDGAPPDANGDWYLVSGGTRDEPGDSVPADAH
jgi:hypothetical protein